jgi:hypothetical protein
MVVLGFLLAAEKPSTAEPISFRSSEPGERNYPMQLAYSTAIWATNHTAKALNVRLVSVEVKAGSNWIAQPAPFEMLSFHIQGKSLQHRGLNAHEAGYAPVELPTQAARARWRVRAVVHEELNGWPEFVARVKLFPHLVTRHLRSGNPNANITINPFARRLLIVGPPVEVISTEIEEALIP